MKGGKLQIEEKIGNTIAVWNFRPGPVTPFEKNWKIGTETSVHKHHLKKQSIFVISIFYRNGLGCLGYFKHRFAHFVAGLRHQPSCEVRIP